MSIDLQQMKARLEAKRAELQAEVGDLIDSDPAEQGPDEPTNDATEAPTDFEEQSVDVVAMEDERSIRATEQALLTEVEDALKRIEQGTYGKCVVCGQPIPEKRLDAIPWAARCVKDEEQLEQRNLSQEETYESNTY